MYSYKHAYDDSDGVREISKSLRLLQYFTLSNWPVNNSQDLDMSTEPVLLPDGQVILAGQSEIVYLLNGKHLGGIGRQQATFGPVCRNDTDGGRHDRVPAVHHRHHRRHGRQVPTVTSPEMEFQHWREAADRGLRPGLEPTGRTAR